MTFLILHLTNKKAHTAPLYGLLKRVTTTVKTFQLSPPPPTVVNYVTWKVQICDKACSVSGPLRLWKARKL